MDEDVRLDIAEALGKATAVISIQAAIVATLVKKNLLSREEAATLAGLASAALDGMPGVPADAKEIAEAALRGFSKSWTKLVIRN